ncbi:MAG: DUF3822 family protein, partial [Muribaculaceae bacterium]|nr:DUF3822 family protein [Muribaculaceae bacterium]
MSNLSSVTSDITVKRPELWTLMLAVNERHLQFILYTPAQENSLIAREIPLKPAATWTAALENAVYDNPVLLDDYGRVS